MQWNIIASDLRLTCSCFMVKLLDSQNPSVPLSRSMAGARGYAGGGTHGLLRLQRLSSRRQRVHYQAFESTPQPRRSLRSIEDHLCNTITAFSYLPATCSGLISPEWTRHIFLAESPILVMSQVFIFSC